MISRILEATTARGVNEVELVQPERRSRSSVTVLENAVPPAEQKK